MGWYETCEICGATGKYTIPCDCYNKEVETNVKLLENTIVLETFFKNDKESLNPHIILKLKPMYGHVRNAEFFLHINLVKGNAQKMYMMQPIVKE